MKKLFLILLLTGCAKETITPNNAREIKCPQLDVDNFTDTWTYQTIQNYGQPVDTLNMGLLQTITIDNDSVHNALYSVRWEHLYCNVIKQEGEQDLIVYIDADTMTLTGVNNGTIWTLTR